MKYKKAAILLQIKIAEHINKIEKEIQALEDELIGLNQTAHRLQTDVEAVKGADERVGGKLNELMEQYEVFQTEHDTLDPDSIDASRLKMKMMAIDNEMKQLQASLEKTKANADNNKVKLQDVKLDIISKNERLEKLKAKRNLKIEQRTEVEEKFTDETIEGSTLGKNIENNVKKISKLITLEERKLDQMTAEAIAKNPALLKRYNDAIEGWRKLSPTMDEEKSSARQKYYEREIDKVIAIIQRDNPGLKQAKNKIDSLKNQRKLGAKAEDERLNVGTNLIDIFQNSNNKNGLNQSIEIFNQYFKSFRDYFVSTISRSLINHLETKIKNNEDYARQFFYTEDDETRNLNFPRIMDTADIERTKYIIQIDKEKVRKEIESLLRGTPTSREDVAGLSYPEKVSFVANHLNNMQQIIIKEILPSFVKEEFDLDNEINHVVIQDIAKKAFVDYFFNPEATLKPVAEIGMPANEIIKKTTQSVEKYLELLKINQNEIEEVPDMPTKKAMPDKKNLGYTIFKSLMGDETSIQKLKEMVKEIYLSMWDDDVEFNVWQPNDLFLGAKFIQANKSFDKRTAERVGQIRKLEENLAAAVKEENTAAIKALSEQIHALKEETKIAKRKLELKIEESLGLNIEQQNAFKALLGGGTSIEQPIGGEVQTTAPRIAVRANMTFLPDNKAKFTCSLSTSQNRHRDAGLIEFNVRKIGKKKTPNKGNVRVELNKQATQPVFKTMIDPKTKKVEQKINNVGQSSNIRGILLKILKGKKKAFPGLSDRQIIKKNKKQIINELKKEIYGVNYKYFENWVTNKVTGEKTKGHPKLQKLKKEYEAEMKKQLEQMSLER